MLSDFDPLFNDYGITVYKFFGELQKIVYVSQIKLSTLRESQIQSCINSHVEFYYLTTVSDLDELISKLKKIRESNGNINSNFETDKIFGRKTKSAHYYGQSFWSC